MPAPNKNRVFEIIEKANEGDRASRAFDFFIIVLIILSIITMMLDTFKGLSSTLYSVLFYFDIFSVAVFTVEYILRIWTSNLLYPEHSLTLSRVKYVTSAMAIIDLLAILPFYIPFIIPVDLRILRIVRLIRIARIFKLNRYSQALNTIGKVLKNKSSQLLSTIFVIALLIVMAAVLMYNIESAAQPEAFDNILSGFWWAIATITTVGYGDIIPVTFIGKALASVIRFCGIALVAIPTGIISAGFSELSHKEKE
jgi:voltage-gated potassium channel